MSAVIIVILIMWGAYYFARWFFSKGLPKLLVWLMHRQARKQYEQFFGSRPGASSQQSRSSRRSPFGTSSQQRRQSRSRRSKIFTKDVGEYVEFEEISTFNRPAESTDTSHKKKYPDEPQISDVDWEDL